MRARRHLIAAFLCGCGIEVCEKLLGIRCGHSRTGGGQWIARSSCSSASLPPGCAEPS